MHLSGGPVYYCRRRVIINATLIINRRIPHRGISSPGLKTSRISLHPAFSLPARELVTCSSCRRDEREARALRILRSLSGRHRLRAPCSSRIFRTQATPRFIASPIITVNFVNRDEIPKLDRPSSVWCPASLLSLSILKIPIAEFRMASAT